MKFAIDPSAPRMSEDYQLQDFHEVESIMKGAREICSLESDNDKELWSLTRGGQFVRQTGIELSRYYVVPADEALRELEDLGLLDAVMADLKAVDAFGTRQTPAI